jgi:SAM-dependent methyltransferase
MHSHYPLTKHEPLLFPDAAEGPIDWELLFCSHVLGLPSLHWGCWAPGEPATLENFRRAQERFRERVLEQVPPDATRVLDVGCGCGDGAAALARRGHEVTGIAPIANYAPLLADPGNCGFTFVQAGVESFETDAPFDCAVFSESCGYFPVDTTFRRCQALVRPRGHVVVANMFRTDDEPYRVARHHLDDFLAAARRHGFEPQERIDITSEVVSTARFYSTMMGCFALPALGFARFWLENQPGLTGLLLRAARPVLHPRIDALQHTIQKYRDMMDPDRFTHHAAYLILRFRRQG